MSGLPDKVEALVVGGGPAGLMAAEELARAGARVVVAEAMPSFGRKFLMAGKSGLNLTKDEAGDRFLSRFDDGGDQFAAAVAGFGPRDAVAWAEGLGQQVFVGSTSRVFPAAMKASPLLRAWLTRLAEAGVELRRRWRWTGWNGDAFRFETPDGARLLSPDVAVLALGGASWRRLGSDGAWAETFAREGITVAPFKPANVGLAVDWSDHMQSHFGSAMKGVRLIAGSVASRGEFVITRAGLEGGGVYEVSMAVRDGAKLYLDLMPDSGKDDIAARLARARGKASIANRLRKALGLDPVKRALLMEWARPLPGGAELAALIKELPVVHGGPVGLDQAISTGGGVDWLELEALQLTKRQGVFVAGEMLDWEAPTGGYLLTGCLATGRMAGRQAAAFLRD